MDLFIYLLRRNIVKINTFYIEKNAAFILLFAYFTDASSIKFGTIASSLIATVDVANSVILAVIALTNGA
jgi:hypothetical protein